jgi:hypothetical protein
MKHCIIELRNLLNETRYDAIAETERMYSTMIQKSPTRALRSIIKEDRNWFRARIKEIDELGNANIAKTIRDQAHDWPALGDNDSERIAFMEAGKGEWITELSGQLLIVAAWIRRKKRKK